MAVHSGLYQYEHRARLRAGALREREVNAVGSMKADYLRRQAEARAQRMVTMKQRSGAAAAAQPQSPPPPDLGAPAVRSLLHKRNSSAMTLGSMQFGRGGGGSRERSRTLDDLESGSSTITEVYLGRSNT